MQIYKLQSVNSDSLDGFIESVEGGKKISKEKLNTVC